MQRIHFAFVKSGLDDNWGTVYLTATQSTDEVRKSMQKHGINTYQYEEGSGDGSLIILRGEEIYKNPNNPDLDNWINATKSISDMFISKGKKGVRVAADLSAYFISHGLGGQWHKLEYALGKKLSLPMSILCAYDSGSSKTWDTDLLKFYDQINSETKEFVDAHSFVIYTLEQNSVILQFDLGY